MWDPYGNGIIKGQDSVRSHRSSLRLFKYPRHPSFWQPSNTLSEALVWAGENTEPGLHHPQGRPGHTRPQGAPRCSGGRLWLQQGVCGCLTEEEDGGGRGHMLSSLGSSQPDFPP